MENKRLTRSSDNRIISGVAAGIAEYLGIDPIIVRVIFIFLIFCGGGGLLLYLVLLFIMPDNWVSLNERKAKNDSGNFVVDDKGNIESENVQNEKDISGAENVTADEVKSVPSDKRKNSVIAGTIIGLLLIGVGVVILFSKLFSFCWTQYFFPVLLVLTGIILIVFSGKHKNKSL
jgi:phage shock protein C